MKAHLVSFRNGAVDLVFPLVESGTRVGRGADNIVQLPVPGVSKQHAVIHREGDAWVVTDLGSTNGTTVNGDSVEKSALQNGDRLGFGPEELIFTTESIRDKDWVPGHAIDLSDRTDAQTLLDAVPPRVDAP